MPNTLSRKFTSIKSILTDPNKKSRPIIFISAFFALLLIVAIILSVQALSPHPRDIFQNPKVLSHYLNNDNLDDISSSLIQTIGNYYDTENLPKSSVYIRPDSVESSEISSDSSKLVFFLIDIDSIERTFRISYTTSEFSTSPNTQIYCTPESESKYPDAECPEDLSYMRSPYYYSLLSSLPITDSLYNLRYTTDLDSKTFTINIEVSAGYRSLALTKLLELMEPADLAKYNVTFKYLDNPFTDFKANSKQDPESFLRTGFSSVDVDYEIHGKSKDNYYYGYLRYYINTYIPAIFRFVLKKSGNSWELISTPYPFLTAFNTPDVPVDLLYEINQL